MGARLTLGAVPSWSPKATSFVRVYVGRVPRGTTEAQLRSAFSDVGVDVGSIEVVLDRVTGLQRGFAFVVLKVRVDVAIDALPLELLRTATVDGHPLDVQGVPGRGPRLRS